MTASDMINSTTAKNLAAAYVVPIILARIKLRWIAFGVVAYYGLKILSEKGLLPAPAHRAMNAVEHGIDLAKEKIGFSEGGSKLASSTSSSVH